MAMAESSQAFSGASTAPAAAPTGPRCQHLQLLKLQGEPVDIREASKSQEAVADFLACLSPEDVHQAALPDLTPLRLTHPTNCHEHAKGLCECALANLLVVVCLSHSTGLRTCAQRT